MLEVENQMGLFETAAGAPRQVREPGPAPDSPVRQAAVSPAKQAPLSSAKPVRKKATSPIAVSPSAARKVSGLVPVGDVRLTANIRQDLHLKLKIASAHRRTTIGEILEELIAQYI